jgi:malate dehydrogenase (oxaloacetate-decarboxylating)
MPVLHDDQHATAVVTLAALLSATRMTGESLDGLIVGLVGLGAAGLGIAQLLRAFGVQRVIGTDLRSEATGRLAQIGGQGVTFDEVLRRAHVVIATTGAKGLIPAARIQPGQIIFALSNPDPEIEPTQALEAGAAIAADGKSINNILAFPGLFAGAMRARAPRFTDAMLLAAARAIGAAVPAGQLVPDPLNGTVHGEVAAAVAAAAAAGAGG